MVDEKEIIIQNAECRMQNVECEVEVDGATRRMREWEKMKVGEEVISNRYSVIGNRNVVRRTPMENMKI